jgi:hypothetical protein
MVSTKKKILKRLFMTLVIIIAIPAGLYIAGNYYYTSARIYEMYWNINLPYDIKEKYNAETPQDFQGDGSRYTVFQIKDADAPFLAGASDQRDVAIEDEVLSILNTVNAEKNWYPDFSRAYLWKKISQYDNKLYIIYDSKTSLAYFIQNTR